MKTKFIAPLLVVLSILSVFQLSSCGSDDPPIAETEEQIFLKKLTGTWTLANAQVDGKDVSKSFPGLALRIDENKSIAVTNPVTPIWKASTTFVLEPSGSSFLLKRNDGLVISVPEISASKLVLTFLFDPATITGKETSVKGQFKFELNR